MKLKVTRYCPVCKRTTKHELTMEGDRIVSAVCLSKSGHSEWWKKGRRS